MFQPITLRKPYELAPKFGSDSNGSFRLIKPKVSLRPKLKALSAGEPKINIGFLNFSGFKYPLANEFIQYFGEHPFGHIAKPLKPNGLVLIQDSEYERFLEEKRKLLAGDHAKEFFGIARGYEENAMQGSRQLLDLILGSSASIFARKNHRGDIENKITNEVFSADEHPLKVAGRLIQEDIALLQRQGDEYVLAGGSVYFPSQWRPGSKLGLSMDKIHHPIVPGYKRDLAVKVNNFLDDLDYQPQIRFTALVHDSDQLSRLPRKKDEVEKRKEEALANVSSFNDFRNKFYFRLERETFQRLNKDQIVMFIRVQTIPLKDVEKDPALAQTLLKVFEHMPTEFQRYRAMEHYHGLLVQYLRQHVRA